MTPFSLLCRLCGLSTREAAALHGVRPDTAESWSSGRRSAPPAVLEAMAALHRQIETAAAEAICLIRSPAGREAAVIEIGFCADDAEAQGLGFPTAGSHAAVLARVVAAAIEDGRNLRLAPRGSTAATALAADAHRR